MFNRMLDRVINWYVSIALRKYRVYPPAKTAVLFVNVQRAFTSPDHPLVPSLQRLQLVAREQGFRVVHAPYGGHSQRFPSPAHTRLSQRLEADPNGREFPTELAPCPGDIVLDARPTLSCFMRTDLHDQLQAAGIEHLVVVGPYANLALDSTVRDGVQHGYHVTILTDCMSTESVPETNAVLVTIPRYAQTVTDLTKFQSLI